MALVAAACTSPSALSWFDPTTRHLDILLGPGLNGGQVLDALEFPTVP